MNLDRLILVVILAAILGGGAYAAYESRQNANQGLPNRPALALASTNASKCQELRADCDPKTGLYVLPTRAPTTTPDTQPTTAPTEQATDRADCNRCDPNSDSTQEEPEAIGPSRQTDILDRPIRVSILAKETQPDGLYIQKCNFELDHSNWLTADFKVQNNTDHVVNGFGLDFDAHSAYGWTDYYLVSLWYGVRMIRIPPHHFWEGTHLQQFLPRTDIIHCYLTWWYLDGERGD